MTDANVVLGRLSTRGLLGGAMSLDVDASFRVIGELAAELGLGLQQVARGILEIMSANMVRAIRAISVERGHDPRDFVLMPFGGAGPLHVEGCARSLGIPQILIPLQPGILCAQGLLVSDPSESFVRSQRIALDTNGIEIIDSLTRDILREAEAWWEQEHVPQGSRTVRLAADMRYASQNYELQISLDDRPDLAGLRQRFFDAHVQSYGFFNAQDPIDVVAVRLTAHGARPRPQAPDHAAAQAAPRPRSRRPVWFSGAEPIDTPVYDRADFAPGTELSGPAVIDQFDATLLLFPGDAARVDGALAILVQRGNLDL